MLTAVEVTNSRGNTLRLPLGNAANGYAIRDIEGLDPVAAALTTSSLAQQDGAQPQNARRDTRNITMKIGLEPNWATNTVQSLKSNLYEWFMTKANLIMSFYIDGVLFAVTSGQVETVDNVLFSTSPEVDISIICYNPDFQGPEPILVEGITRVDQIPTVVTYDGTSETGAIFTFILDRVLTNITINNTTPENVRQRMLLTGNFMPGDAITFNTNPGQKAVTLTRARVSSSLMAGVDLTSSWISLSKGDNLIRVTADTAGMPYTMSYMPQYGAI